MGDNSGEKATSVSRGDRTSTRELGCRSDVEIVDNSLLLLQRVLVSLRVFDKNGELSNPNAS